MSLSIGRCSAPGPRRVYSPGPGGGAAADRQGHRRGARPLHEGSQGRRERRGGHCQAGRPGVRGGAQEEVRILVVGGGGREHALCWALKRDAPQATVLAAPGNPGTAQLGTNLEIEAVGGVKGRGGGRKTPPAPPRTPARRPLSAPGAPRSP